MTQQQPKGSGLDWFVRRGSTTRGPYSSARIRHFVLEGRLELEDEVSADGETWRRLGDVHEVVPLQLRDDGLSGREQARRAQARDRRRAWRAIAVASSGDRYPSRMRDPPVQGWPVTFSTSLTPSGMPSNRPPAPSRRRRSASRASARAWSASRNR